MIDVIIVIVIRMQN